MYAPFLLVARATLLVACATRPNVIIILDILLRIDIPFLILPNISLDGLLRNRSAWS